MLRLLVETEGLEQKQYWFLSDNGYLVGVAEFPYENPRRTEVDMRIIGYAAEILTEMEDTHLPRINSTTFITEPREHYRTVALARGFPDDHTRRVVSLDNVENPFEESI